MSDQGVLRVRLSHALGLKSADSNGFSDPYVKLTIAKEKRTSKIVYKTLDPVWNETLTLPGTLQDFLTSGLLLKCFDWDSKLKLSKDDPLGNLQVSLDVLKHADARTLAGCPVTVRLAAAAVRQIKFLALWLVPYGR